MLAKLISRHFRDLLSGIGTWGEVDKQISD